MGSEKFSAALRVGDLNDFIAPSVDCVVLPKSKPKLDNKDQRPAPLVVLQNTREHDSKQLGPPQKISLKDCLACSGCLTSAETVLLEKQSHQEFLSHIDSGKTVIVSISPQSRASLAGFYGLSTIQVFRKLTTFFRSLGVKAIYDTSCSRDLSLIESCHEFISRYKHHMPSNGDQCEPCIPVLSSACPGWICYAEKTLGSYILPYISSVKSPQQVIGSIIKHHIIKELDVTPDNVYHVTVMPCYDKKLEAVRDDFVFSVGNEEVAEVDAVLTSGEVLDLIQLKSADFKSLEEAPLDKLLTNVNEEGHLYGVSGGSGGYAETIFRYAAKALFGREIQGSVEFKCLRNLDFREATLEVDGEQVLKVALCYGFRNLQNIVRKIKTGKCEYHFVEVMACPSGCLNGGGQIKPEKGQSAKALIQHLESIYMKDVLVADPCSNPIAMKLYEEWLEQPGSDIAKKYLHTQYHALEKSKVSLRNW